VRYEERKKNPKLLVKLEKAKKRNEKSIPSIVISPRKSFSLALALAVSIAAGKLKLVNSLRAARASIGKRAKIQITEFRPSNRFLRSKRNIKSA
jgi:hypothetical protein